MLAVHEIYYYLGEAHDYFGNPEKATVYYCRISKQERLKAIVFEAQPRFSQSTADIFSR